MPNAKITTAILFLVFNRPEKTQRVFDVIKSVKPTKLYVAADAPRDHVDSDKENCAKVREIVTKIDWDCTAKYLFHEKNLGCSLAGKTAWDWIFGQEVEIIFIEDDGLVSTSFFCFCQELLGKYRYDERIAYIGGVNYGPQYGNASYFFSRIPAATYCMATWKRVYELYEYKMESYNYQRNSPSFKNRFVNTVAYKYMIDKFDNYVNNGGNTYDIQMNYLAYKHDMYSIVPNINLGSNIGLDFGGANNNVHPQSVLALQLGNRPRFEISEIDHPDKIEIDKEFEKQYFNIRVFQGKSWTYLFFRFYLHQYFGPVCLSFIKRLLKSLVS